MQWRCPLALQSVFALIALSMLPFLPESPRWLISRGHISEGTEIIARVHGKLVEDPAIASEVVEIVRSLEDEKKIGQASWNEVFSQGRLKYFQRMLLGCGPLLMNQWCGINTLSYTFNSVKLNEVRTSLLS